MKTEWQDAKGFDEIPSKPGIYKIFPRDSDVPAYIGMSKNLSKRVTRYHEKYKKNNRIQYKIILDMNIYKHPLKAGKRISALEVHERNEICRERTINPQACWRNRIKFEQWCGYQRDVRAFFMVIPKCNAITLKDNQCKFHAKLGEKYCGIHLNKLKQNGKL